MLISIEILTLNRRSFLEFVSFRSISFLSKYVNDTSLPEAKVALTTVYYMLSTFSHRGARVGSSQMLAVQTYRKKSTIQDGLPYEYRSLETSEKGALGIKCFKQTDLISFEGTGGIGFIRHAMAVVRCLSMNFTKLESSNVIQQLRRCIDVSRQCAEYFYELNAFTTERALLNAKAVNSGLHEVSEPIRKVSPFFPEYNQLNQSLLDLLDLLHGNKPHKSSSFRVIAIEILVLNAQYSRAYDCLNEASIVGTLKVRDIRAFLRYNTNVGIAEFMLYFAQRNSIPLQSGDFEFVLLGIKKAKLSLESRHVLLRHMQNVTHTISLQIIEFLRIQSQLMEIKLFHLKIHGPSLPKHGIARLAICNKCGAQLLRSPLNVKFRDKVLLEIREKCYRRANKHALLAFLNRIHNTRMDVIVDGANVGFSGLYRGEDTNITCSLDVEKRPQKPFSSSPAPVLHHLWFEHIDAVIRSLCIMGLRPVVMLHQRHIQSHRLWDKYMSMVQSWISENILICTPNGIDDDLFWLYAVMYHSGTNHRTYIVTNDLVRDHQFALDEQSALKGFHNECRVPYQILPPGTFAKLHFPLPYSIYPQFSSETSRWHLPTTSNGKVDWHCCRLN